VSDDVNGYPGAPPGWYPDPAGGSGQRWWDGYDWTEATVAAVPPTPPPPPPPRFAPAPSWGPSPPAYGTASYPDAAHPGAPNVSSLVGNELSISRAGRLALAFPGAVCLADLIVWMANASQWRNFGHQFHLAMLAAQNHQTAPTLTAPDSFNAVSSLLGLCAIAALIVACVWQFRAATAARALRLPAKRSPGWGVVFWFIPVVNLWMPYQAIRDCLAPADPNRALVLRFWLCTVGIEIGTVVTLIGLMTSTYFAIVTAIPTALCALGVLASAPKVVVTIATAHHAAVNP
jgi:Domain of unknown function (DUF4328)/Protein of unknown function (DUF2510)